jgi:hypothetical protein
MTSSRRRTLGPVARARASSRRLSSNRVSSPAGASALAARPVSSKTASTLASASFRLWPGLPKSAPTSRFSRTVSSGRGVGIWKARPRPRWVRTSGGEGGHVRPRKRTRPTSGRRRPEITLSRVLFPAPLGPITARISHFLQVERDPLQGLQPEKALGHPLNLQNPSHAASSRAP